MNNENKSIIKAIDMFGRVPEQWELLDEIERLNNNWNKLKHWVEVHLEDEMFWGKIYDKIQTIDGSDKE